MDILKFFTNLRKTRCSCLFFLLLTFLLSSYSLADSTILHQKVSLSLTQKDLPSIFNDIEKKYNIKIYYGFPLSNEAQSITIQDAEIVEFLTTLLNNSGINNCAILADDQNRIIYINNLEMMKANGASTPPANSTNLQPPKVPTPSSVTEKAALPSPVEMKDKIPPVPPFPDTIPPLPGTNTPISVSEMEARNKNATPLESITLPGMDSPISISEIEARSKNAKSPESFTLPGQDTPVLLSEIEARNKAIKFPESINMPDSNTPIFPGIMEKRGKVTLRPEAPTLPDFSNASSKP